MGMKCQFMAQGESGRSQESSRGSCSKGSCSKGSRSEGSCCRGQSGCRRLAHIFLSWVVVSVGEKTAIEKEVKANPPTAAKTPKEKAEATLKTKMENVETEVGEDCRP